MRVLLVFMALAATISGCRSAAAPQPVELPPIDVPVATPLERTITDFEEYTGRIMAVERVNVMARVDGYLSEIRIKPGELVRKGDLLFVIDRRPYQAAFDVANGQLQQAEARAARLTKDYQRLEKLVQSKAVTAEEFDKVAGELAEARAAVVTARAAVEQARLNLEFAEVRAPIDGRVGRQLITVGNLVQGATMPSQASVLTDLVSVDNVYVYFDAPERDVLRYRRTMIADHPEANGPPKLEVDVGLFDESGYPHKAVVDFVADKLESGTGTQTFRAVMPNPKRGLLAEGMFARVRIAFSKPYTGLVVSERAIMTVLGGKCVYVINDQNVVEERPVDLGRVIAPGLRHVKAGILPTDRIAVSNLQRLIPGTKVKPVPAPMPAPPGS